VNRLFTEREWAEIEFARTYTEDFRHGTDGHIRLMLISKLANTVELMKGMMSEAGWLHVLESKSEISDE